MSANNPIDDPWLVRGSTFTITLSLAPFVNADTYSTPRIYYKRPDNTTGFITPDTVTSTAMVGTVTPTVNPLSGRPGKWSFYPYLTGSGTIVYRGKRDTLTVHDENE